MSATLGPLLPGSNEGFVLSADGDELTYIEAALGGGQPVAIDGGGWRVNRRTYDALREMAGVGSAFDTVDNVRVTPTNPAQLTFLLARAPVAPSGTSGLSRRDAQETDSNGCPMAWPDSNGHGDRYGVVTEPSTTWWLRRSELVEFEALA